jgi:integrase
MKESVAELRMTAVGPRQQWYIRVRKPGKDNPSRVYLGLTSHMTKPEARKERDKILEQFRNTPIVFHNRYMTVGEFIDTIYRPEFLIEARAKRSTIAYYEWVIKTHILPTFGKMKIGDVRVFDVNKWLISLRKQDHSYYTMATERGILQAIFKRAEMHELIEKNPVRNSEIPAERELKRPKRMFSKEDIAKVIEAAPDLALKLRLGVSTGMRISEILGLRWVNVDLINGTLTVKERVYNGDVDTPKNLAVRGKIMPLGSLLDEMRRHKSNVGDCDYVFPSVRSKTLPTSYTTVHVNLRDVLKQLGMWTPGFSFHALRRTYISVMNASGANAVEVASAVGKASVQSLLEYQVLSLERHAELVERVQKEILEPQ